MAVGTGSLTYYQGENVAPRFTVNDSLVTDITGWTIKWEIKVTAADADPPVASGSCTIIGGSPTLVYDAIFLCSTTVGSYVFETYRDDAGSHWALSVGTLTILDRPSEP